MVILDDGIIGRTTTAYFDDLKGYKPLSRTEERNLIERYRTKHDIKARDKLIKHNLRFACKFAAKYRQRGVSYDELISDANMGLIESIDKFNLKKDVKLITYSRWWILQKIGKSIMKNTKLNEDALPDEYDPLVGDMDDDILLENRQLMNLHQDEKVDREKQECISDALDIALDNLTPRESDMVNMYYGRKYECRYPLAEIGKKYGVTKERVRQIILKCRRELKTCGALAEVKTAF
jgi:RNA polymerase primary sigma factor